MHFFILVLLVCFFVFLYSIYSLAHDDFVLTRKDISVEVIFNASFLCAFFALLMSRIFYVSSHPKPLFSGILGFLLFPYFPGLSIVGCLVGGLAILFTYSRVKKLPFGRLFDFFSFAFSTAIPFGFLGEILLGGSSISKLFSFVFYLIFLILTIRFLLSSLNKGNFRDGTYGLLFLTIFFVISFVSILIDEKFHPVFLNPEILIIIAGFIFSFFLLVRQETKKSNS